MTSKFRKKQNRTNRYLQNISFAQASTTRMVAASTETHRQGRTGGDGGGMSRYRQGGNYQGLRDRCPRGYCHYHEAEVTLGCASHPSFVWMLFLSLGKTDVSCEVKQSRESVIEKKRRTICYTSFVVWMDPKSGGRLEFSTREK
eukprot:scaffold15108_cov180-Amphora_coffeaeformis.AAC.69